MTGYAFLYTILNVQVNAYLIQTEFVGLMIKALTQLKE